jgi:hypothetical protein
MFKLDLRFSYIPPYLTFFLKPHDVYGSDYAATAKSAPTKAIASSQVQVVSFPIIVLIGNLSVSI